MDVHGDLHLRTERICCPTCGRPKVLGDKEGVSLENSTVFYAGKSVRLTYREAQLFELLLRNFKQVVHRDRIWEAVWKDENVETKIVDVYVCKLKKKLRPLGLDIKSSWGIGKALIFAGGDVANVAESVHNITGGDVATRANLLFSNSQTTEPRACPLN